MGASDAMNSIFISNAMLAHGLDAFEIKNIFKTALLESKKEAL
ncbi:MAG: hypothetical protein RLZZ292_3931, partial [Bacteroidota bacterium]